LGHLISLERIGWLLSLVIEACHGNVLKTFVLMENIFFTGNKTEYESASCVSPAKALKGQVVRQPSAPCLCVSAGSHGGEVLHAWVPRTEPWQHPALLQATRGPFGPCLAGPGPFFELAWLDNFSFPYTSNICWSGDGVTLYVNFSLCPCLLRGLNFEAECQAPLATAVAAVDLFDQGESKLSPDGFLCTIYLF